VVLLGSTWILWNARREVRFTSEASFAIEDVSSGVSLRDLQPASLLSGGSSGALTFYVDLVQSRAILMKMAASSILVEKDTGVRSVSLASLAGVEALSAAEQRSAVYSWLKERVKAEQRPGNVIEVRVSVNDPAAAQAVAERLLAELQRFNAGRRQGRAAAERVFVEGRMEEVRKELESAEGDLVQFLRQNRLYEESPDLRTEFDRRRRRVELKQEVLVALAQTHERARAEEVRDTPTIFVIDAPEIPLFPDPRPSIPKQLGALLVLAALLGAFAAASRGLWAQRLEHSQTGFMELRDALHSVVRRRRGAPPAE
jgi:uncharacterized protein involved in exopolysaccharide biosynthesis